MRIDFAGTVPVAGDPLRVDFAGTLPVPGGPMRIDFAANAPAPQRANPLLTRVVLIAVLLLFLSVAGVVSANFINSKALIPPASTPPTNSAPQSFGPTSGSTKSADSTAGAGASSFPASTPTPLATQGPKPTLGPISGPKPTLAPTGKPKSTLSPTPTAQPVIDFVVTPTLVSASCKAGLTSFQISLDNKKSNASVSWQVTFDQSAYPTDWGTSKPATGTLDAGQSATATIYPATDLCSYIKTLTDFTVTVKDTAGSTLITYEVSP